MVVVTLTVMSIDLGFIMGMIMGTRLAGMDGFNNNWRRFSTRCDRRGLLVQRDRREVRKANHN
jgi:hypothetical protein